MPKAGRLRHELRPHRHLDDVIKEMQEQQNKEQKISKFGKPLPKGAIQLKGEVELYFFGKRFGFTDASVVSINRN